MVGKESFLGDTPRVIAPGPEKPALTGRRLDYTTSRGSFQPTQWLLMAAYMESNEQKRKNLWENAKLVQLIHKIKVSLEMDLHLFGD